MLRNFYRENWTHLNVKKCLEKVERLIIRLKKLEIHYIGAQLLMSNHCVKQHWLLLTFKVIKQQLLVLWKHLKRPETGEWVCLQLTTSYKQGCGSGYLGRIRISKPQPFPTRIYTNLSLGNAWLNSSVLKFVLLFIVDRN